MRILQNISIGSDVLEMASVEAVLLMGRHPKELVVSAANRLLSTNGQLTAEQLFLFCESGQSVAIAASAATAARSSSGSGVTNADSSGQNEMSHAPCVQAIVDIGFYPLQHVLSAANQLFLEKRISSDAIKDIKAEELLFFCDKLEGSRGAQSHQNVAASGSSTTAAGNTFSGATSNLIACAAH